MDKRKLNRGTLYIVATPIGNMEDITLRAIRILTEVDVIAAEDTRQTGKLLSRHNIRTRLISVHEHNEASRINGILEKISEGASIALVSDAGTPTVSDPGFLLVRAALENDIPVVPIPGVSAAITALSVSGLPTDSFLFTGFLPKKRGKREERLRALADQSVTVIMYESPKRIAALLEDVLSFFGDRYCVLAREMTKQYEEFQRGMLSQVIDSIKNRIAVKGEFTLLVSGKPVEETVSMDDVKQEMINQLNAGGKSPSTIAKEIAGRYGLDRSQIYKELIALKDALPGKYDSDKPS